MNINTRYFNGTHDGQPYHAIVTRRDTLNPLSGSSELFEVEIVIFNRTTGEPIYAFERTVFDTAQGQRAAVRAVIKDPEAFV